MASKRKTGEISVQCLYRQEGAPAPEQLIKESFIRFIKNELNTC